MKFAIYYRFSWEVIVLHVFTGVTNDMTIAREEIFGPVLCVLNYRSEQEAIAIANDTIYGLKAYMLSSNPRTPARSLGASRPAES